MVKNLLVAICLTVAATTSAEADSISVVLDRAQVIRLPTASRHSLSATHRSLTGRFRTAACSS